MSGTTVLGAGVSGLSAAYYLRKRLPKEVITIIEASNRVGGWIKSNQQEDGVIFEQGPRTLRPHSKAGYNLLTLIDELGLAADVHPITSKHPSAGKRFIYINGKLHSLPSSIGSLFRTHPPFSKPLIKYAIEEFFIPKQVVEGNDESIYSFTNRRFGQEVADYLISPLVCGIYAGNAREISVNSIMRNIFEKEQKYGGVLKGLVRGMFEHTKTDTAPKSALQTQAQIEKWSSYTFKNGLETLPTALAKAVKEQDVSLGLNMRCSKLEVKHDSVILHTEEGGQIESSKLISTVPADVLGTIIQDHPDLSLVLKSINSVTVAVVNLQFSDNVLPERAFGFLVPPSENKPILGVIYDSSFIPCGNDTVLTVMMGGYWFDKYFGANATDDAILETALKQVQEILNISQPPKLNQVKVLRNCIPQYVVGHDKKVNFINDYIKSNKLPLLLCGSSYNGVGINDVVMSAKGVVDSL